MAMPQELEIIDHTIRIFLLKNLAMDVASVEDGLQELDSALQPELTRYGYSLKTISGNKSFTDELSAALAVTGRIIPMKSGASGHSILQFHSYASRTIPMKSGASGPVPALSLDDPAMVEMLDDNDEKVKILCHLRVLVKTLPNLESKLRYLKKTGQFTGGRFPVMLEYSRANTGRFSGGNGFNIQNMPSPANSSGLLKSLAIKIRSSILAPPGKILVASDASQIEARILAFVSGQHDLHKAFAEGRDIYSEFASSIFNISVKKVPGDNPDAPRMQKLRGVGKTAILGLGYGMGKEMFIQKMTSSPDIKPLFDDGTLSKAACCQIVNAYRRKYGRIKQFWSEAENAFISAAYGISASIGILRFESENSGVRIVLPSGRKIIYNDVRVTGPYSRKVKTLDNDGNSIYMEISSYDITYAGGAKAIYSGKIVENIVQAVARDILVDAILRLEQQGWPVYLHIHDEIICAVPESQREACQEAMIAAWRTVPQWIPGLVLDAECKTGSNMLELKE